jgi:cell wall-associated NlpC family hydrolase
VTTISRAAWVATLLGYEGTPYAHQGRLAGVGMDCPAPLICAAREHGIVPAGFDVAAYALEPDGSMQPTLERHLVPVAREALQLGDVVLNAFRAQPPRHLAYIVGRRHGEWEMLHACSVRGRVIIERIPYGQGGRNDGCYWRYVQGYAVPGVGE